MKALTAALASLLLSSAAFGAGPTVLYSQNFESFPTSAGSVDGWWNYFGPSHTTTTFGVGPVGNAGSQGLYMTADSSGEIGTDWYFYAGIGRSNIGVPGTAPVSREDAIKFSIDINPQNSNAGNAAPVGIELSQWNNTLQGNVWSRMWTPTLTANTYTTVSFILNSGADVPANNLGGAASVFDPTLPISINAVTFNSGSFPLAAGDGVYLDNVSLTALAMGDANGDGTVDLTDLATVLNNFGSSASAWSAGNFDGAGTVDMGDLNAVLNNFGSPTAPAAGPAAASAAPEPASVLLLALGAPLILVGRRKLSC